MGPWPFLALVGHKGAAANNFPLPQAGFHFNWGEGGHNHPLHMPKYYFQAASPWLAAAEEPQSLVGKRGAHGGTIEGAKVARATGGEQGVRSDLPQGARANGAGEGWMEGTRTGVWGGVQRSDLRSFPCAAYINGEA